MKYDVYVINLDHRTDRWSNFIKGISQFNSINPIRYSAVKNTQGFVGCALSHINIIEMAKNKGLPYVIVMEDDTIIIDKDFDNNINKIIMTLSANNYWDIFNGNPSCCNEKNGQIVKLLNKDPNIISFEFGYTTNFIIYSSRIYDKIIGFKNIYNNCINNRRIAAIDVLLNDVKKCTHLPYLTCQRSGYSDIEQKLISYDGYILSAGMEFLHKKITPL